MGPLNHKESSAWSPICFLWTLCHPGWVGSCNHSNSCHWRQNNVPLSLMLATIFRCLTVPLPQPASLGIICLHGSRSEQDCCSTRHMCFLYPGSRVQRLVVIRCLQLLWKMWGPITHCYHRFLLAVYWDNSEVWWKRASNSFGIAFSGLEENLVF